MQNPNIRTYALFTLIFLFSLGYFLLSDETNSTPGKSDLDLHLTLRSYYANDQRLQWTGLEASSVAEGAVAAAICQPAGKNALVLAGGELFINQPFDKNILTDPGRQQFAANFRVPTVVITSIYVGYRSGAMTLTMGKIATPFGRFYYDPLINDLALVAPFIRSEVILPRETGLLFNYSQGIVRFDLACVTGVEDRDTNSSPAPIVRLGLQSNSWAFGMSAKKHDGNGSANQKMYGNYFGADAMVRFGGLSISGEATYDEYGFKHEVPLTDIYWPRSFYYRELHRPDGYALKGWGGYGNIQYSTTNWAINFNYGEYYPEQFGNPYQDTPIRRAFASFSCHVERHVKVFLFAMWENNRPHELWSDGARGIAGMLGVQYER